MSVDAQQITQSATPQGFSPVQGSVASAPAGQSQQGAPETQQPRVIPWNQVPQVSVVPQQAQEPEAPATPQVSAPAGETPEQARLREENQRLQQQVQQSNQFMTQLQTYAQQQQMSQDFQSRINTIIAAAEGMAPSDANVYLKRQVEDLVKSREMQAQQSFQAREQQFEQERKLLAAPQYAEYLVNHYQMPAEAKERLLAFRDPDIMLAQAPFIKADFDRIAQLQQSAQQTNVQTARAQEIQAMSQAGFGHFGGQNLGNGDYQIEVSDDPDERAMQVLAHLRMRDQAARQ